MTEIAVTGLGAVTALGQDFTSTWSAVREGQCGLRPLTRLQFKDVPSVCVGEVQSPLPCPDGMSPSYVLAQTAAQEAARDAALPRGARIAVILGTTTAAGGDEESWFLQHLAQGRAPADMLVQQPGLADFVGQMVGATGPRWTVSTACSSGAQATLLGQDLLASGRVDYVLAGGVDALCWLPYLGFSSLRLLSSEPCRPFDEQRSGLSLGEGAGMLVMEAVESAERRGVRIHGRLLGGAVRCDAHHMTAPAPDGGALASAMQQALQRSAQSAAAVGYINAHGTGTPANDPSEAAAFRSVFADSIPPVSSSKSMLGHTLGAAGAIEAAITIAALRDGVLPPTVSTQKAIEGLDVILGQARPTSATVALSTSVAFGGNNVCLVFAAEPTS